MLKEHQYGPYGNYEPRDFLKKKQWFAFFKDNCKTIEQYDITLKTLILFDREIGLIAENLLPVTYGKNYKQKERREGELWFPFTYMGYGTWIIKFTPDGDFSYSTNLKDGDSVPTKVQTFLDKLLKKDF